MRRLLEIFLSFAECENFAYYHVDGDLTFKQLYNNACRLEEQVSRIEDRGPVLILGHKDRRYIVAIWACILAGRTFVPCESDSPIELVSRIINECKVAAIIDARTHSDLIVEGVKLPCIRFEIRTSSYCVRKVELPVRKPEDDFYIMFSSGTSGLPKGIRISVANILDFVDWICGFDIAIPAGSAVTSIVRFSFDVSQFELWLAWIYKASLSSVDQRDFINTRKAISRFSDQNLSVWVSTPSVLSMYLRDPHFNGKSLAQLNTFLFCGEVLPKTLVSEIFRRFSSPKVFNTYGPTECTVAVTSVLINKNHLNACQELPIGYARNGTHLRLVQNEIVIEGKSVGSGYLTQSSFFSVGETNDWQSFGYRTGDVGHVNKDGLWFFRGRKDRELKVGGVRVNLAICEDLIREHPLIANVRVEPVMFKGVVRCLRAMVSGPRDQSELEGVAKGLEAKLHPQSIPKYWATALFEINRNGKTVASPAKQVNSISYVYTSPKTNFS